MIKGMKKPRESVWSKKREGVEFLRNLSTYAEGGNRRACGTGREGTEETRQDECHGGKEHDQIVKSRED